MSDQCGASGCSGAGTSACDSCGGDERAQKERLYKNLAQIKNTILVMSGKGGVGKSTVAANLAVSLMLSGKRVGLLDIDFHGPSIPTILGLTEEKVQSEDGLIVPTTIGDLKVISLGILVEEKDTAIIWRGPMKMSAIQQLLADVQWGELDYLIIDSPPGTGDEPLSVCQTIPEISGAVIVTTPQKVAIADVRRSISFCHQLQMPVLGVIENMSGFACPKCGEVTDIFKTGGGEEMAASLKVKFLGRIPLDPAVAASGDDGKAYVHHYSDTATAKAFETVVGPILTMSESAASAGCSQGGCSSCSSCASAEGCSSSGTVTGDNIMRFAIPLAAGKLSMHFGHCEQFAILDVDVEAKTVTKREDLTPPPHEPGVLPKWLHEQGVKKIIAGGMGSRAQALFAENGIEVIVGASAGEPEELIMSHLEGTLVSGENICDH